MENLTVVDPTRRQRVKLRRQPRKLVTQVSGPASPGPHPLVIFAHGKLDSPAGHIDLLEGLSWRGYVVAAPTFPNTDVGGAARRAGYAACPTDLTLVVDRLTEGETDFQVDSGRIAVVGHSFGGLAALGVGYDDRLHDQRFRAVVAIATADVAYPGSSYSAGDGTPVLFIHGERDGLVPYVAGRDAYARWNPPKFLLTLHGGGHVAQTQTQRDALLEVIAWFLDAALNREKWDTHILGETLRLPGCTLESTLA
jgi:predicted dienelactone hydrolase